MDKMGNEYRTSFMPYLEIFEPRETYVSELRLQHAWKQTLWKTSRFDTSGRALKVLSPGRHNHSDGPDFIGASLIIDGKLFTGDIEIHHRQQDWYNHGHHLDPAYDRCVLHVVFRDPAGSPGVRCLSGKTPGTCYIELERALECEEPQACRVFKPDMNAYYHVLRTAGRERVRGKIKYFYENRLRFPNDVMLYWGLFKACGYRYNEENMIKLFVSFPWAAYCDDLLDRRDILPMLNELAGFSGRSGPNMIRWTRSRTRPSHFPENRVDWLGKMMTHYYGASLSGMIYDLSKQSDGIFKTVSSLFSIPECSPPGDAVRHEMIMNTVLPLMEAIRMDRKENGKTKEMIHNLFERTKISHVYGTVQRFHDRHGVPEKEKEQKNWLISQGVLAIQAAYCSQKERFKCPVCLMDPKVHSDRSL